MNETASPIARHSAPPTDPIAAVVHADPYPYYAELTDGPGLVFNQCLQLWVAADAAVVSEVFLNPECRVRPLLEPVPQAIAGSSAGEIFSYLVRMNDGDRHQQPKIALQRALSLVDLAVVETRTRTIAASLLPLLRTPEDLSTFACDVPVRVVADLLGFAERDLAAIADWTADFVACLSPLSSASQLVHASLAADALLQQFKALLDDATPAPGSLVSLVRQQARSVGWDCAHAIMANLVGLLSQTFEATAGLIGNSMVALVSQAGLREKVCAAPQRFTPLLIEEISRYDPSIQNTRRFVAASVSIAGVKLRAGDIILLVLAAANRDPSVIPDPHDFILARTKDRDGLFGFGRGIHECPGRSLASTIASAALEVLLPHPLLQAPDRLAWTYRPSANARIPLFYASSDHRAQ